MDSDQLFNRILAKRSYLCVGLDPDIKKIPKHLLDADDPIFEFNKGIIEATADLCVAYKPNLAFYESLGPKGLISLSKTLDLIPSDIFVIADAKRGDIGNTADMYARSFFEFYNFDAVTIAPYMGEDSISPFLAFEDKYAIVLGITSNKGSRDFQHLKLESGEFLYESVLKKISKWGNPDNLMFVVGATQAELLVKVREIIPDNFLLVPGVGAQGGSLQEVSKLGFNKKCGLLVNSSRQILYASNDHDFAEAARNQAIQVQKEMDEYLDKYL